MNEKLLKDFIATAQKNNYNWSTVFDKFPELENYDKQLLKDYVATAEKNNYNYEVVNSKFPEFGFKKKSQAENGGSTLGVGSSASPKTDYSKYKKVGDKYYSGNGEFFDNYPGKEGKGYRFNDNQWYEYSSTILGDKEQIEKLDNPIKDPRRVLALNKQFNKTAGTEKGVFVGYPGKEQNEYKINNDGTWQRRTPENKTWVTVTNENSISALNNQFGQSAKKIEPEKISKIKEDNLYQSNFYANLKSINAQLIGGEEEEAVDVLRRKFPLFTFNEINAGDKIEITSPKGNKEQFTLDNWTWDKDKKISEEMIGWMEGNNLSPSEKKQYANVRRANAEEASFKYPNIGDTAAMKAMQEDMSLNLKKAINPNDVTAPSLESTQYALEKEKANKKAKELRADWMPIKSQKLNDIVNKYSEYTSYKGNVSEYEKTRAQAALGALASDKVEIGNVNKYQDDIKYNIDSYKSKLNDTSFFNNLQNKYDNGEITEDQYNLDYTNRQKELIDQEKEIQNQIKISDGLIKNVNKSVGENYLIQETKGSIGGGLVLGAIKGVLSPVRLLAGSTGRKMSAAEYHEAVKEAISPLWDFDTSLEYLRSEERSDLTKAAFSVTESLGAMAPMVLSGGTTLLGTGLLARGAMTATAFYPMSYYEMKDELEEIDIPESDKVAMASIYGVVSSALESIGMEYALGKIDTAIGSSIKRNILKKVLGKSLPKDAPKEAIDALVRTETKSYIASLGLGTLGAMSVEGVTESLQSLTGAGIKEIYDTAKETEFFSNEGFGDIVKGALYEGYLGALGGGMVHSIYIAKDAYKRNNVLRSKELNNLLMAAKTSGMSEALMSNLKADMLSNRITKEQAEEISNNFEIVRGMMNQMPENLTVEGQSASLSLLLEKNELNKQIEGKDPNLVKRQAARVNEINERLQEIGEKNTVENAIQEQTAGEVPVQPTTAVGEEVVQGEPTAEPQGLTEEGQKIKVEDIESKRIETEAKIKSKDLFLEKRDESGNRLVDKNTKSGYSESVGEMISQNDVAPVPTSVTERNGIEFVEFSNPKTGVVDVIVTGKSLSDFVGFYRIYENGKATNKWSSKLENKSRNKEDFKTMIGGVQEMLPQGHEYTEKTSISTDGLRVWFQQLFRGYVLQYDNIGNLITNRAAINGDAIINDLGVEVNKGNFDNISVKNSGDMKKVKAALLPYLQKFGLNESNIHFENGTVEIDLPVLKSNKVSETTNQEVELTPRQKVEAKLEANKKAAATVIEADIEYYESSYGTIAADYLFTGGKGVILSTDYLLQALTAVFPYSGKAIDNIRNKYANELSQILKDDINTDTYNSVMQEIKDEINNTYGNKKANEIFEKILKNATGFTLSREGNQVSSDAKKLNEELETKINAKVESTKAKATTKAKVEVAPVKEEAKNKVAAATVVEAPVEEIEATPQEKVATYRAEEQAELLKAIPKIESYKVNGEIDKNLMSNAVLAKYNKIYEKYNALISPLLEPVVKAKAPVVKAQAPKAKGELPIMSWSNVDRYKDDVIRAMREIQNKLLTPLLALKYNTTPEQKKQIIDIRAKIALADKILKRNFARAKREQAKIEKEKNIKPTAKVETTKAKVTSKAKVEEEPVEEEAKVEPVVEEVVEVEQYQPITIEKIFNDRFSKENAISYDEEERETDNGRMSTYISSITMDVTNEDGDSIGTLTKLVDEDRIITWNGEDFDGNQLSEQDFDFKDDARQAIVDKWNKEQKKNFDREAKKKIKDAQKAKEKADKAAAKEEAKSASVVKKEEAPAPAKESTEEEGGILNDIEKIQEDIDSINEDIEKARTEARNKVNVIDSQKIETKLKSTLEDLNDKIADIEIALEKVLDPLQIELLEKVTELDQKVKSLKNTENENTLLDYLKKARESLRTLDKLTYVKLDLGISLKTAQLVLDGLIKIVETATNLKKKITLKQAINEMYDKYKDIHPNVSKKRFIQDVNDFLDNTFVEQKTNKENLQDTQDKLVEFEKAVRLIAASKLIEAERVVRKMLKGKVRKLTLVQVKSIMRRLVNFNVFSQTQYDKFIDYVDKVIGIADYDAKVTKANKDRKFAKKNMIKLGDISSDLLVPLSRVLNINAKLIPKDVFESYSEIIEMLSKRAEVLKLNERSNLNESIDKIIESIESNEQRISDLKELYDNFEKVKSKTNEEVYSKTLDKMLKEGVIDKAEHELMKTFKLKILEEKGKVKKMTDQQIADEKVELIKEVKKTTITLDEIVGDEFRLERELVKRLQIILKQTDFQNLNNKELKDLLRVIDNINNGFVSNATQQMVEKLNKIKNGGLLAAAIPKSLKGFFRKAANVRRKLTKDIFGKTIQRDEFGLDAFSASSMDEQLNNFKSTPIFDITREQNAIQIEKFKAKMTEIISELARAENEIASWDSFKRSGNLMQLSKFKMSIYMMQLEKDSNPNSNQVHQAMDTLNATIKFAKQNKGISTYSDLDIKQMESIKEEFQKDGFEKDGKTKKKIIDIDKLYKSFNKQEKDAIEIFKKINSEMTKFATYTATVINGKKIEPINNYFFYNTINENKTSAEQITARINNINDNMNPTTVSKNLEERDGNVHAVQLNPFNAVNISARSVLLNYYMTEAIRTTKKTFSEARKIIEKNEDEGIDVGKQFDILSVLENSYDTAFSDLVESYINESQAFFDFIKKTSYRAMLGSIPRSIGEYLSNAYGAWVKYPKDMMEGKALQEIIDKDLLVNLGSKLTSRLFAADNINSSGQIDLSNITNRITKNGKTRTKIVNGVTQVWDYTAVKWVDFVGTIADELIAKPDQKVLRPLWLGSFSRAFKKETGVDFNENKIKANDEEYMDKYRDALAKATKIADKNVNTLGGNMNSFMGVLQNAVRNDDNFLQATTKNFQQFMGKFIRQDYDSARKGLNALVGNGTISKTDGGILLAVILSRQVLYTYLVKSFIELFAILAAPTVEFVFSLLGFEDDDDDDKTISENIDEYLAKGFTGELQKLYRTSLSAITTVLLGGNSGNALRVAENYFIEKANKKYGEKIGLRDGEYDPYKDAIQFNQFQDIGSKDEALVKIGKVLLPVYSPLIGVTEVGLKLALSPEPKGDRARLTRAKEYVRLGLEAAGNAGVMPFYKDIRKVAQEEVYKELKKETKETAVKKEAQAKTDAEEIVQKTSILKQMMNSGAYTREGIKKELRKIKDPEYRKAEKKIEDDMLKSILDKTKYSSRTDFEKREKENAKNAFKMYDKKREESSKISNELENRMKALKYGEQYVPKKKKASGTFGGSDSFGGSSSFGGSDSFGGGDSFGGSDSFGGGN